jgi:hypothetical protein
LNFKGLTFVGGGRWASTVLSELLKLSPNIEVDWVCRSNLQDKGKNLFNSTSLKNVTLIDNKDFQKPQSRPKVIIASHSSHHDQDFFAHQNQDADMLIEKPLFSSISGYESCVDQGYQSIFINLEFYFAYFIRDFLKETQSITIKKIDIIWHDPLQETRLLGDTKYSEIYSSIFLDQLLHVMSICKVFNLNPDNFERITVNQKALQPSNFIEIDFFCDDMHISISLSRFSSKRERKIMINNEEAELHFSEKPNFYLNKKLKKELHPLGRLFPIAQTLSSFLNYPKSKKISDLSFEALLPFLRFCFECEEKFISSISRKANSYRGNEANSSTFEPHLVYYAGIIYYRQLSSNLSSNIHFLTGSRGVSALKEWWLLYLKQDNA